jgi:predicted permease
MRLIRILHRILRRESESQDLHDEIQAHLNLATQERITRGETPEDAKHAALRELGNATFVQETTRDTWGFASLDRLRQDLRYAFRTIRRSPLLFGIATATLALGIGANAALFNLIDAVLLRSLPVRDPEQLVELLTAPRTGTPFNAFSYQALQTFSSRTTTLSAIIASHRDKLYLEVPGSPAELIDGHFVTGNYFSTLGVATQLGRAIVPADDDVAAGSQRQNVAVLSHAFWHRRFGGEPSVLGTAIRAGKQSFQIVGIAEPRFSGIQPGVSADLWIPLASERQIRPVSYTTSAGYKWLQLVGRRRPGVSFEAARAELAVLFQAAVVDMELPLHDPANRASFATWKLHLEPAATGLSQLRYQFGKPLWILWAIVGIVLLIACANVANLLLARAAARQTEIAIRQSIGADRSRLIRQLLTESLVLASCGGALGVGLGFAGSQYLVQFLSSGRQSIALNVQPDLRLLLFVAAVSIASSILFGLLPALRASRVDLVTILNLAGRSQQTATLGSAFASRGVVALQVALMTVLLFGAGLFLSSLRNLQRIETGFSSEGILLLHTEPRFSGLDGNQRKAVYRNILDRVSSLPGVHIASLAWTAPVSGGGVSDAVEVDTPNQGSRTRLANTYMNAVTPRYFEALRIPVVAGREFTAHDRSTQVVVNLAFARKAFGDRNAVGQRVWMRSGGQESVAEIIGVTGDTRYMELREQMQPTVFFNNLASRHPGEQLVVRVDGPVATIVPAIRRVIGESGQGIVVRRVTTLREQVESSIVQERLLAALASAFGILAVLLGGLGLYGVINYRVTQRSREFGIRTALGAQSRQILGIVLREVAVIIGIGVAAGIPAALLLGRFVTSLLYGLTPDDAGVLTAASSVLALVGLAAGLLPAVRASRQSPLAALRAD